MRDVADRYQEQKYVALASASMVEILLVGIPVLVSVKDSASATFIVLTAIVALDDIGKCDRPRQYRLTCSEFSVNRSYFVTTSRSLLYFRTKDKFPKKGARKGCTVRRVDHERIP